MEVQIYSFPLTNNSGAYGFCESEPTLLITSGIKGIFLSSTLYWPLPTNEQGPRSTTSLGSLTRGPSPCKIHASAASNQTKPCSLHDAFFGRCCDLAVKCPFQTIQLRRRFQCNIIFGSKQWYGLLKISDRGITLFGSSEKRLTIPLPYKIIKAKICAVLWFIRQLCIL